MLQIVRIAAIFAPKSEEKYAPHIKSGQHRANSERYPHQFIVLISGNEYFVFGEKARKRQSPSRVSALRKTRLIPGCETASWRAALVSVPDRSTARMTSIWRRLRAIT